MVAKKGNELESNDFSQPEESRAGKGAETL
jgi:hypothetical protein